MVLILVAMALLMFVSLLFKGPEKQESVPRPENAGENFDKTSYEIGYSDGYEAAKEENESAYRQGYQAAEQEIGSGLLTRTGLFGVLAGVLLGLSSFIYIKRQDFSVWFQEFKKRIALRRAYRTIPQGLTPDIDELAHRTAQSYIELLAQFRMNTNYLLAQYTKQWTPKLDLMMRKALNLLELIQELESVRANIDEKELARRVRNLKRAIQSPTIDDNARNAAVKSLQRAKQTQQEFSNAKKNLEHCTRSFRDIGTVLESMRLKVSNLKVNTRESELLDELSSELEDEIQALEEALSEIKA